MTESTSTRTRSRAAVKAMGSHRLTRPVSTSERVADALRDEISDGVLPPGVQLVEESLAEALGVSRNTVRESFALLAGEGIVDRIPSRGVFVAILGVDDVHDLYRARMMVEGSAMRWGNPADAAVLGEMHRCLSRGRECRDAGDWDGVARANHSFHRAVASLTGSDRTTRWFASLLAQLRLVFHRIEDRSFHAIYIDDNARVLAYLEADDREAATKCLLDYLERARDDVLDRLTA